MTTLPRLFPFATRPDPRGLPVPVEVWHDAQRRLAALAGRTVEQVADADTLAFLTFDETQARRLLQASQAERG